MHISPQAPNAHRVCGRVVFAKDTQTKVNADLAVRPLSLLVWAKVTVHLQGRLLIMPDTTIVYQRGFIFCWIRYYIKGDGRLQDIPMLSSGLKAAN